MTSLLLCWYSLGWCLTGAFFAESSKDGDFSLFTPHSVLICCFLLAPVSLVIVLLIDPLTKFARRIDPSKQYLWRKP